jgi:hypothetical protein
MKPTISSRLEAFYRQVPPGLTDDQVMREIAFKILLGLGYAFTAESGCVALYERDTLPPVIDFE